MSYVFSSTSIFKWFPPWVLILMTNMVIADEYQQDIDQFFQTLKAGNANKAVDDIYKTNPYVSVLPEVIANLKEQLNSLPKIVGGIHSIEEIDTYTLGSNLVQVTYIAIYDRQPLRFEFQFFKVQEGWRIFSLSFDDKIFIDIQEHGRLNYLSTWVSRSKVITESVSK